MDTKTLTYVTIFSILTLLILGFLFSLIVKKVRLYSEINNKIKASYGIWLTSIIAAVSLNTFYTMDLFSESIDTIVRMESNWLLILQTYTIFIGINIVWIALFYYVTGLLIVPFMGKRKLKNEIELDNVYYFSIRAGMFIFSILIMLSSFEAILRFFMPSIEVKLYH